MKDFKTFKFSSIKPEYTSIITTLNVIHTSYSISGSRDIESFKHFIIPLFFQCFTGPFLSNIIFPYFKVSKLSAISFLISLPLFFFVKRLSAIQSLSVIGPLFGKILLVCDMKNSGLDIHLLIFWIVSNSFIGNVVGRLLSNDLDKFGIETDEAFDIFYTITVLMVGRMYNVCDIVIGLVILLCFIVKIKAFSKIQQDLNEEENEDKVIIKTKKEKRKSAKKNIKVVSDESPVVEEIVPEEIIEEDTDLNVAKTPKRRGRPKKSESGEFSVIETPIKSRISRKKRN